VPGGSRDKVEFLVWTRLADVSVEEVLVGFNTRLLIMARMEGGWGWLDGAKTTGLALIKFSFR
jgi:hypothetical protein